MDDKGTLVLLEGSVALVIATLYSSAVDVLTTDISDNR